jgi:hypothetical protein
MSVRAKFRCSGITKREHWDKSQAAFTYDAEFHAVTGGSEENKAFFAATPTGNLKLSTVRADLFEPGKDYYLDFTPAE